MILSVSRRTDIPSFYSEWFLNWVKEGYLYVRNPMNIHQVSKIDITPNTVDCIVFWTKNPQPMLNRLDELCNYNYYFQFTLTGYGNDIELNISNKFTEIIPAFQSLSKRLGQNRVIWRYDPVLLSSTYTIEYHLKAFESIAKELHNFTNKVIISFIDMYPKITANMKQCNAKPLEYREMIYLATEFKKIANKYCLEIESCAEKIDLTNFGISHAHCVDQQLIEEITGCKLSGHKDKNQRTECGCFESVDVGSYNTCKNGCKYCYANHSSKVVNNNALNYDVNSPLLCSKLTSDTKLFTPSPYFHLNISFLNQDDWNLLILTLQIPLFHTE